MALCAAWPSLPFINATTDGTATLHKKHTVRLGGAPIEITIKLRLCGAPLRCKGLSYVAVGTYKQFCVGLGEDSGALPIDPATTAYRHGAQCSPTDSDLRASIVYAFRCDEATRGASRSSGSSGGSTTGPLSSRLPIVSPESDIATAAVLARHRLERSLRIHV